MPIYDRYLLQLFVKVLLVCFFSITGLYVVIDACNNLDEFLNYGRRMGGVLPVLTDYYSARVPWFFDQISGLLTLIASMFAVTWLRRTNEMTALQAAGISAIRITRPLLAAAVVVSLLAAANREVVIPQVRDKLTRNAQNWLGEAGRPVEPVTDNRSGILISGRHVIAAEQRIEQATCRLHRRLGSFGRKIEAENAYYRAADAQHPAGYLLDGVDPDSIAGVPTAHLHGQPVIFSPLDTPWLEPDQCFLVSEIGFQQLAGGSQWRSLASTGELVAGLRNPSLTYGLDTRVTVHSRIVQPLLDLSLLFLGLPLVLTRENRNLFVAAGWCLLIVIGFIMVVIACRAMGSSGYLLSPVTAAWLPLLIFGPIATFVSQPIWE